MNERQLHLKGEEEKRHNKDFESSTVKKAVINNKSVVDIQNNSCVAVYGCRYNRICISTKNGFVQTLYACTTSLLIG